jgi:hypothetical protein
MACLSAIPGVAFSPDGHTLVVTASKDGIFTVPVAVGGME